jgi:oligosaccharide repeat unit polymerase
MAVWYEKGGWCTITALGAYGFGSAISFFKLLITNTTKQHIAPKKDNLNIVFIFGVGLLIASILGCSYTLISVGNILQFSRTEIFGGIGDTRGFGFFLSVYPASIILLVVGSVSSKRFIISISIAVFSLIFILLLGYRSVALFPAIIASILWIKTGRKIPKVVIIPSLIFILFAIPTVRYLRSIGAYNELTYEKIEQSVSQAKIIEIFHELGATSGILANTLKWIPNDESYRYGYSYLAALKEVVPNISLNIAKSDRLDAKNTGQKKSLFYMSPSDWYIYKYNRWMYDTGGGSGFTMIAEAYYNFGIVGIVIIFTIIGFIITSIDLINILIFPYIIIYSAIIMWPFMKMVRNTFASFVKSISLTLIAMIIWYIIVKLGFFQFSNKKKYNTTMP